MFLEESPISQPSGIGESFIQTAPKSSLRGKSLSEKHSSIVESAITLSEITGTSALMVAHGVLIQILTLTKSGYYSKSAPATDLNSTRIINSIHNLLFPQYLRKARRQVTVASLFTAIMTNHCSSRWKKYFTQVKA